MIVQTPSSRRARRRWAAATICSSPSCVLAATSRGRPSSAFRVLELARVDRRRRRVDLQVADSRDRARAELLEAARQRVVLRQHEREAVEQRPQQPARAPPLLEAAERHAAVHERQRHAGVGGLQDQVRPDLGLGEHGEIGPPMIQERARVARRVERHVLVDGARARPPPREARRGHGARRQQETQRRKLGAEGLDQRQDRIGLADGGVQPHEPAFGARRSRSRAVPSAGSCPPCRCARASAAARGRAGATGCWRGDSSRAPAPAVRGPGSPAPARGRMRCTSAPASS